MKKILRQAIPWTVAIAILGLLFKQIPPGEVLKTVQLANLPLFFFYAIAYFIVVMLVDCLGLRFAFKRFVASVSFSETLFMRGATYLLMLINYNLGQGGMALYLKRTHQAPVFKTLGTIFYLTAMDLSIMLLCGIFAGSQSDLIYRGIALGPLIFKTGILFISGLILWLAFWRLTTTASFTPLLKYKPVTWLIERPLFFTFREAKLKDHLFIFSLRLPIVLLVLTTFFLWTHPFYAPIPWPEIFVYGPVVLVTGTLPITPAGVGTVQAVCVEFFKHSLSGPLIEKGLTNPEQILLAGSLLWGGTNALLKCLFGMIALKKKSKALFVE